MHHWLKNPLYLGMWIEYDSQHFLCCGMIKNVCISYICWFDYNTFEGFLSQILSISGEQTCRPLPGQVIIQSGFVKSDKKFPAAVLVLLKSNIFTYNRYPCVRYRVSVVSILDTINHGRRDYLLYLLLKSRFSWTSKSISLLLMF